MKTTVFKPYRKTETISRIDIKKVVRMIAEGDSLGEVHHLREMYHLMRIWRKDDGRVETNFEGGIDLPRLCFAAEWDKHDGAQRLLKYN